LYHFRDKAIYFFENRDFFIANLHIPLGDLIRNISTTIGTEKLEWWVY